MCRRHCVKYLKHTTLSFLISTIGDKSCFNYPPRLKFFYIEISFLTCRQIAKTVHRVPVQSSPNVNILNYNGSIIETRKLTLKQCYWLIYRLFFLIFPFFFWFSSHIVFTCHVSYVPSSLWRVLSLCLVFHDLDHFEEYRSGIFYYVPQCGFVWCFLEIRLKLHIFSKMLCPPQWIVSKIHLWFLIKEILECGCV